MITLSRWILYFIIYSFMGWLLEVSCFLVEEKRLVNRGFLIGPICPIYGYGVLLIIFLIGGNTTDILSVFLKSIFICSILEYTTSYVMEKLFKARWWDYSNRKYNINGRICLETMIPFGILGSVFIIYVHPFITSLVEKLNDNTLIIISVIILIVYLIDNFISFNVMSKIKKEIKNHKIDSTEIIRSKVMKWLNNNSYLFKHIMNAFPKFEIKKSKE